VGYGNQIRIFDFAAACLSCTGERERERERHAGLQEGRRESLFLRPLSKSVGTTSELKQFGFQINFHDLY
jgi:hypothetical protein